MDSLSFEVLKKDLASCEKDLKTLEQQAMMILGVKQYIENKLATLPKAEDKVAEGEGI